MVLNFCLRVYLCRLKQCKTLFSFAQNRSDGRVDRASVSELVDLGFDPESGQTNDFKIGIHSFPA